MTKFDEIIAGLQVSVEALKSQDVKLDEVKGLIESLKVSDDESKKDEILALVESLKLASGANLAEVEALLVAPEVPVEPVVE